MIGSHLGNSRKYIRLGNFRDFDDACRAREEAEKLYGYSPLHGKTRKPKK